jgi:hypothetical protein
MMSRAWILLAAALVAPAWSQEPANAAPAVTLRSIDLNSPAIRQIIRDTAATQFSTARVVEETPAPQKPALRESTEPAPAHRTPALRPAATALLEDGFLTSLIDVLLDHDDDNAELIQNAAMQSCLWNYRDQTSTQRQQTCHK